MDMASSISTLVKCENMVVLPCRVIVRILWGKAWMPKTGVGTWLVLDKVIIVVIIKKSQLTMKYGGVRNRGGVLTGTSLSH